MAVVEVPPYSPGVGARRRGPKSLPKLPMSAFTPPSSGVSDRFPLPPSPSTLHPDAVVDGLAAVGANGLDEWKSETGQHLWNRLDGVVAAFPNASMPSMQSLLNGTATGPVIAAVVPLALENGPLSALPEVFTTSRVPVAASTVYTKPNEKQVDGIKWALSKGLVVNIDVQCDLIHGEDGWEALEDLISKCVADGIAGKGAIVLSNILPPPQTLEIPLVKLLTHPSYRTYQARVASLSLFPSTYISFLPPHWNAATPATPPPPNAILSPILTPQSPLATPVPQDSKDKREWKRRIKMYVGPVLEAFGFQRIIFGSCKPSSSNVPSKVGDWYELARESFAELGVEQEGIDAVFGGNAKQVYAS